MEEQGLNAADRNKKILDLEKYRLKLKLKDAGVECHEDRKGKFRMWIRLAGHATGT
jgi:hypothetical protein